MFTHKHQDKPDAIMSMLYAFHFLVLECGAWHMLSGYSAAIVISFVLDTGVYVCICLEAILTFEDRAERQLGQPYKRPLIACFSCRHAYGPQTHACPLNLVLLFCFWHLNKDLKGGYPSLLSECSHSTKNNPHTLAPVTRLCCMGFPDMSANGTHALCNCLWRLKVYGHSCAVVLLY